MTGEETPKDIPASHPRRISLVTRARLTAGVHQGMTSFDGLIAHGRGEAFDYLLGERTHDFALRSIEAAAAYFLIAEHPVISVNGNTAALVPAELVALSELLDLPLEVNIFHANPEREMLIRDHLIAHGARNVLLPEKEFTLPFLDSNRRFVNGQGISRADLVFVPLEDGDRCEALIRSGRKVVTIDLNPLSRTAQTASVTIVDNIVRALPLLVNRVNLLNSFPQRALHEILESYDNRFALFEAERVLRGKDVGG
ncbi:MAG: phosphopantothenate/pantothenate synthetase [Acidobacteria bacterium]|nr:phosphopantothenate/pantothenate synthetase [Acidobacteriota bacterium]